MARRRTIHVAIGSTWSRPGDVLGNISQIARFARRAARDGVDLLLTPELSATGYGAFPRVLATAEVAGCGPIYRALTRTARETGVVIGAGFVEAGENRRYIAHYVIWPGGRFVVQRKHSIAAGERPLDPARPVWKIFKVAGVRCGLAICADAGVSVMHRQLAVQGVQLLLLPAGAGGKRCDRVTDRELRTARGRARYLKILEQVFYPKIWVADCLRRRRAIAAVNLCGYDGLRHYHAGHGFVIGSMGEVPAFFHGQPNLDRQRPMYVHAVIDVPLTRGDS
jgi:predicted amidohydrolase